MSPRAKASLVFSLLTAALGAFFVLLSTGLVGHPSPSTSAHQDPSWLGTVIGLVFLLGGGAAGIKSVLGGDESRGDLPPTAPAWLKLVYQLMSLGIVASLGLLMTWVGIGPGERHFTGSGAFLGETPGRIAFALAGAVIWLVLGWLGIRRLRRALDHGSPAGDAPERPGAA